MRTPCHVLVNIATLANLGSFLGQEAAVFAGAVAPDLPIMVLYASERLRGTSEEGIWGTAYQRRHWLAIIHGAHSIPLAAIGMALGLWVGKPAVAAFFASMLLHAALDFPVHAIDAHRHFLPFSQYRFQSPFSYWDVRFHARYVALVEVFLVLLSSYVICRRGVGPIVASLLVLTNLGFLRSYFRNFLA
jgi:hypothetical protein